MRKLLSFLKKYWLLVASLVISFLMFYPALSSFYTHDDFFFLKIAKVSSFGDFVNFFNLVKDSEGIGVYRPLPLRVYYFLASGVFNLNPLPLRIISFVTFFIDVVLVHRLAELLTKNRKIALLSSFLYATSVTHFGQLYYIGAYQELLLTLFFLASVTFFIKYEIGVGYSVRNLVASFLFFILALMSKETGVILPFILIIVHFYLRVVGATGRIKFPIKKLIISLLPYGVVLGVYLSLHFLSFGLISGDSYIWDFAPGRALNTSFWYFLWSLNLPEMLIDFVGPGLKLNPNLLKYWSADIIPIFVLFTAQAGFIVFALFKSKILKNKSLILFCVSWFLLTISPVVFLPVHKFTYYLTLPLFGVIMLLSYLLNGQKPVVKILFCTIWVVLSLTSLRLTLETNWITQGVNTSERVNNYFKENREALKSKDISFVDTPEDKDLPWSPTLTLKTVLSEYNFFDLFYPELRERISYGDEKAEVQIRSRQLLGY